MYDNPQAPGWVGFMPQGFQSWYDNNMLGPRGFAWEKMESEKETQKYLSQNQLKGIQDTNQSRVQQQELRNDAMLGVADINRQSAFDVATAQGSYRVQQEDIRGQWGLQKQQSQNQGQLDNTNAQGGWNLANTNAQGQWNYNQQLAQNQGQLDNTNAQGGWNLANTNAQGQWNTQQEQIRQQGAMGVAGIRADGQVRAADITGSWQNTAADTKGRYDVAGKQVTAAADMYGYDQQLAGTKVTAAANMYNSDNVKDTEIYKSDNTLREAGIQAASANFVASEQRKAGNFQAQASMMGQVGAAAAGAKIGLSDAIPEMMKRGYNPMAGGMENISRMGNYARREERQAQLAEARDNTSFWARRDAQNQAKWADNNAAQNDLRLQRAKNRGDSASQARKGNQAWMMKTLFGG